MRLPERIQNLIDQRAASLPQAALEQASVTLSAHYREGRATAALGLSAEERVVSYLVTRLPATFAAAAAVMEVVHRRLGGIRVSSVLDLGAGTGAATLAAREVFPELADATLVEPDPALAAAGKLALPGDRWIEGNLLDVASPETHDLVIASYALGELPPSERAVAVSRAWQAARVALVVIEPGTTRGFTLVRDIRDRLLKQGARMIAPCPTDDACPIISPDWCHFAARVERSSLHRRMKKGALSYEDEKFSYVALARAFAGRAPGRVIRRPAAHTGWVELTICANGGIHQERVSRKQGATYRAARKANWGDAWPPD